MMYVIIIILILILNITKICKLNYYININRPDVIMLNETWLKKSVSDHEIIKDKNWYFYK